MYRVQNRHEGFLHFGVQPFMDGAYEPEYEQLGTYDVTFLGVPTDHGVSYRRGAMLGPKTLREYSFLERVDGKEFFDTETETYLHSNTLTVADFGNVFCIPTDPEKTNANIAMAVERVRRKSFPVVAGGDHGIAYSTIKGCLAALPEKMRGNFAVLHLDAHLDTEEDYEGVPRVFHGNPFRRLIEEGHLSGTNLFSVGMRGLISKALMDYTVSNGVQLYTVPKIRKMGFGIFVQELVARLSRFDAVYVTFDIDSIDPSEAKGTGTPMENGLRAIEVQALFRALKPVRVVGFELVEVAPEFDPSSFTTIVATNCLWNFLAFGLRDKGKLD